MKNFLIVIVALLATSCSKSDSGDSEKKPEQDSIEQLLGTWSGDRFLLSEDGKVVELEEVRACEKKVRVRIFRAEGKSYLLYNNECVGADGKKELGEGFAFYLKGNQFFSSDGEGLLLATYSLESKNNLIIELLLKGAEDVYKQRFVVTKTSSTVSLE